MVNKEQNVISKKKKRNNHKWNLYPLVRQPCVIARKIDTASEEQSEGILIKKSDRAFYKSRTDKTLQKMYMTQKIIPTKETNACNNSAYNSMGEQMGVGTSNEIVSHTNDTKRKLLLIKKSNHLPSYVMDKVVVNMATNDITHKIFMKSTKQKILPIQSNKDIFYTYSKAKLQNSVSDTFHKTDMTKNKLDNVPNMELDYTSVTVNDHFVHTPLDKDAIEIITLDYKNWYSLRKNVTNMPVLGKKVDTKLKSFYFKCRDPMFFKNDVKRLKDVQVCSAAESKNVVFHYSGTNINRLLTFAEVINKDIQILLKNLQPVCTAPKSNRPLSFTVAINLDNLEDYFDLHDKLNNHVNSHWSLQKVKGTIKDNMSLLPINASSSIYTIFIKRQIIIINIIICKYNALCARFLNSLATLAGIQIRPPVRNSRTPALMFHHWHFLNVAQGYLLQHLLKSSNVITLNTIRKVYFVLIFNPFPYLDIQISYPCLGNFMFCSLTAKPLSSFSSKSLSWSKVNQTKRMSSVKVQPVIKKCNWRARKLQICDSITDTLPPKMENHTKDDDGDLNSIFNVPCYTDSESIYTRSCDSEFFSRKKSVATVSELMEREPSAETVVFKMNDSSYDLIVHKDAKNYFKISGLNFLSSKILITFPKIFHEKKNLIFRCYSNYTNESFIYEIESAKDHYVNLITTKEFPKLFFKSVGKLLITTVLNILI